MESPEPSARWGLSELCVRRVRGASLLFLVSPAALGCLGGDCRTPITRVKAGGNPLTHLWSKCLLISHPGPMET